MSHNGYAPTALDIYWFHQRREAVRERHGTVDDLERERHGTYEQAIREVYGGAWKSQGKRRP